MKDSNEIVEISQFKEKWRLCHFDNTEDFEKALLSEPNEDFQCTMIKASGYFGVIKIFPNPSEKLQRAALSISPTALSFINNPHESIQSEIISEYPNYISFIKHPSEKIQLLALEKQGSRNVFPHINQPTKMVIKKAVAQYIENLQHVLNPSQKMQDEALNKNIKNFSYINNPSEKSQKRILKYIKEFNSIYYTVSYRANGLSLTGQKYLLINSKLKLDPIFLRLCYQLISEKKEKNIIMNHPNFIKDDASLILNELLK